MKVLHLGKFDTLGGIERHVRSLAGGLAASGEVEPINLVSNDSPRSDRHADYGYLTVRAACWGTAFSLALSPTLPQLARALHREHRFDIVHLHFPDPLGLLTANLLPESVRRVISWHSDIVRQKAALFLYQPLVTRFARAADALVAATPQHFSTSEQIPHEGKPGQVRAVIPYGFEAARFAWSPAAESRLGALRALARGRPAIFTVGRHVWYKGFEVLIAAMREVDALLWIGGTGPLTDALKQSAVRAGVADRVIFTGRIPDEELPAYYTFCDVFAMPSTDRSEAFGLVQLEAMHFGKPVLSTLLGNGVEYVNRQDVTGLLVPPRDPQALVAALRRLLADPALRAAMGSAGQERVASEFSVPRMVDQTLDVYRRILGIQTPHGSTAG